MLLATFAAFAMLLTTSCSKDLELKGTTWTGSYTETADNDDPGMTRTYDMKLNFTTENSGTWNFVMKETTVENGETITDTERVALNFGYSISGNSVNITGKSIDDPGMLYITGVVNDDHNEMTVSLDGVLVVLKKQK